MRRAAPPEWLLAFWKEIDDKTFGKGFDCFTEDATLSFRLFRFDATGANKPRA
jgi:uncharacterized protein YwqG